MFWITGQNRTSCRRSSAILAAQRPGGRVERGGGKYSAWGTEGVVLTSMFHHLSDERDRPVRAASSHARPALYRPGILRSFPRSRKSNRPKPGIGLIRLYWLHQILAVGLE